MNERMELRSAPRLLLVFLTAALALVLLHVIAHVPLGPLDAVAGDSTFTWLEVPMAALVCWRAIAGPRRVAWAALAAFAVLWTAGDLGWVLDLDHQADPPSPNWTDALYLASYAGAYIGVGALLRSRARTTRLSLWLDGLIAGLALSAVCADLFLGPVVSTAQGSVASVAVTLAYPVLDLLMLCMAGVAFGVTGWRPGLAWTALAASMVVEAVGDTAYVWQNAVGNLTAVTWIDGTWPIAMLLLAWAAWLPESTRAQEVDDEGLFAVPAAFAAVALGVLTSSRLEGEERLMADLAATGALSVSGVRAWLTHRENVQLLRDSRREALEDGLTGLLNRRRLMLDLERTLAEPECSATLAFFDLDGFKSYNDSFGHGAGDALLVRLARGLDAAVAGLGRAYRLGGDEFCVLFDDAWLRDDAAMQRAVAALRESGEGFAIGASYGLVSLPQEAASASAALQLADERMYGHKGSRRGSPGRQGRDLLMQILREREPELEEHVDDVGTLALAVGRKLGLGAEALDEIARGAELHDIGKIAIPETILHKPGPLNDEEWAIMAQHTVVGERILMAAPSLRPVARLVRSSHERWDGTGYPDRIAGERIPLGARIIAVCDAFDAMRQERPYAPSMSEADALAELRRCAGAQFDPDVVAAFAAVLAAGDGPALRVA